MRLNSIVLIPAEEESGQDCIMISFAVNGVAAQVTLVLPVEWSTWTRAEKVTWARQQIASHLQSHQYTAPYEILYPDPAAPEQAADDLKALPGWATWTTDQAEGWIQANVTDLASAKTTLKAMARAIVLLRDIVLER